MQLGRIVEKAKQLASICQEENAELHRQIGALEREFKVKFERDDECEIMLCDEKVWPNEDQGDGYPFDSEEWLDMTPKDPKLKELNMKWSMLWENTMNVIKRRANLFEINTDEFSTRFRLNRVIVLRGYVGIKRWEDFSIEEDMIAPEDWESYLQEQREQRKFMETPAPVKPTPAPLEDVPRIEG